MEIINIINAINLDRIRITDHAYEEADADHLFLEEILFSVLNGEIIEDYPNDKPYPSCLVYGKTFNDVPIHSVWAFDEKSKSAIMITVYKPDPDLWIEWKERRKKQ